MKRLKKIIKAYKNLLASLTYALIMTWLIVSMMNISKAFGLIALYLTVFELSYVGVYLSYKHTK